ncbi:PadR family transcriptional regulator [Rhodovibrio salinarum]|uniref:PadR family transcriptional regulator n=1 Tax=Rhodovibrio salinarum TaxID=1087 RepID=A0A934QF32_9PROT|nr:PadR family transcriptional regulator [Rhodovibrio salinarum]MBK1695688.1 PadR family transcriptional regulator [Rhodovibrio salinarum]
MDTRTLCLGVLNRGDASGYEIKKSFEEGLLAHFQEASFGSIYPALTRLSADGLVVCHAQPQDKRPDKKLYSITASGRAALERALHRRPVDDEVRSDFLFVLFFAHLLPAATLDRLIDDRITWYEDVLQRMSENANLDNRPAGERFVHGLGLAVYQCARDYLREHRDALLAGAADAPANARTHAAANAAE